MLVIGGVLLIWILFCGPPIGIALVVLHPVERAAEGRRPVWHFTLLDVVCFFPLVVQLSIALCWGLINLAGPTRAEFLMFPYMSALCFGLVSCIYLPMLSQAGITNPWHRAGFLLVVLPCTVCGSAGVSLFAVFALSLCAKNELPFLTRIGVPVGGTFALATVLVACAWFTRHVVKRATPRDTKEPAELPEGDRPKLLPDGQDDQ